MEKINKKVLVITSLACLLPILIGLFYYNQLPEQVAIHFDINNNPNNYFSKSVFIFGMPVFMMLIQIFCCVTSDLSDKNKEANKKTTTILKWIIPVLTIVLYIVTIMYALGSTLDIRIIVMFILGIMFIVMGNYTPKTKGMLHLGNKKITDENLERKVNRICGYMFIINGLMFMISTIFNSIVSVGVVGIVIVEAIVLTICTWRKVK